MHLFSHLVICSLLVKTSRQSKERQGGQKKPIQLRREERIVKGLRPIKNGAKSEEEKVSQGDKVHLVSSQCIHQFSLLVKFKTLAHRLCNAQREAIIVRLRCFLFWIIFYVKLIKVLLVQCFLWHDFALSSPLWRLEEEPSGYKTTGYNQKS